MFERGGRKRLEVDEEQVKELHAKIGELAVTNSFFGTKAEALWREVRRVMIEPNQVWCSDITYLPMSRGFLYLVAIMDWHTRKVLSWRISNTLEADFCVEALNEAIHKFGPPEIMNTDSHMMVTSSRAV